MKKYTFEETKTVLKKTLLENTFGVNHQRLAWQLSAEINHSMPGIPWAAGCAIN